MKHDIREFFTALSALRISRAGKVALWATVGSMLFIATAQQSAYGLDFPMTTRLTLADSKNLTVSKLSGSASLTTSISEMALVAGVASFGIAVPSSFVTSTILLPAAFVESKLNLNPEICGKRPSPG